MSVRGVIQRPGVYDRLMRPLEGAAYGRRRRQLFRSLTGAILELGVGTGLNFDAYGPHAQVTAFDIEPQLVHMARARAEARGAHVLIANAHSLPFPDACFDHVTAALVFCTIPQPALALHEVARVLRPGGQLIQLEHTCTDHALPDALLRWAAPSWKSFTGGCVIDRDTVGLLQEHGWQLQRHQRYVGGLVRLIAATPPAARMYSIRSIMPAPTLPAPAEWVVQGRS